MDRMIEMYRISAFGSDKKGVGRMSDKVLESGTVHVHRTFRWAKKKDE